MRKRKSLEIFRTIAIFYSRHPRFPGKKIEKIIYLCYKNK